MDFRPCGLLGAAPQEGDGPGTGAGDAGTEGGGSRAGGYALAYGPDYGVGVVSILGHIREWAIPGPYRGRIFSGVPENSMLPRCCI